MRNWISTLSGLRFDFDEPSSDQVDLDDIAVALGNTCRWGGHVRHFYSVAEHAVLVAGLVTYAGGDAWLALAALHHDDHEAYIGDWPTPLKNAVKAAAPGVYEGFTAKADAAICEKLGIDPSLLHHDMVVAGDQLALVYEAVALKPNAGPLGGIDDWRPTVEDAQQKVFGYKPEDATELYLHAHQTLVRETSFLP